MMASLLELINSYEKPLAYAGLVFSSYLALKFVLGLLRAVRSFILAPMLNLGVNPTKLGSWAVVTGATDGIGKAYAMALAKRGMNIVLISRSADKLAAVAEEISSATKVQTKVVKADFSGGVEIYDGIERELENLNIGLLVNNVGMSYEFPEYFHQVENRDETFNRLLHVNVFSLTFMTAMVLPKMVEKRKGAVVNIGSASCFGFPLLTVYAATKAYVDSFSKNLDAEYSDKGIIVQSVYPHHVSTKMSRVRPSLSQPTADQYAKSLLATLGLESETTGYLFHWLPMGILQQAVPQWLLMKFIKPMALSVRARALRKKAAKKD